MVKGYDQALRERVHKQLQFRAAVSANAFGAVLIAAAAYQSHRPWLMFGALVAHSGFATAMAKLTFGRSDRKVPNLAFTLANTIFGLVTLHALNDMAPAYLVVPLMVLLADGFSEGDLRWHMLAMLSCFLVVPLALGAPPFPVIGSVLLGWVVHWFSEGRAQTLRAAMAELREQAEVMRLVNAENGNLYAKMVAQERLSSLGLMAAGVAHEVNNPLAFVSSNVNALRFDLDKLATSATLRAEYRDEIIPATVDGMARVNAIISDLRRFARADPARKEIFDLDREVVAALRVCKGKLTEHCEVKVELEQQLKVEGQPGQVCQVLVNLISNAAHAMRARTGRLSVTARRDQSDVLVTVTDQGEGMPPEVVDRIFEPFFTTKPHGEGTGLGLSVVHGIVRSHGGAISVATVPGEGSTFTVRLPAARSKNAERPVDQVQVAGASA
jgi:two-component system, NtrC family, sensor kinase